MVRQTHMNGELNNGRWRRKSLGRSIADLVNDVVLLTELQWQLLMQDFGSSMRRGVWAGIVVVSGATLVVCAIPIALLGAVRLLALAGVPLPWSFLIVAAVAATVGALTAYLGVRAVARCIGCFNSSRVELRNNITWLKQAVKHARSDETLS